MGRDTFGAGELHPPSRAPLAGAAMVLAARSDVGRSASPPSPAGLIPFLKSLDDGFAP